jgi:hypothetical protein
MYSSLVNVSQLTVKMEAPLSICNKEEMRGVIRFLFTEGIKPVEIIRGMQAQYGDNCLSRNKIYECSKREELLYAMRSDQEHRQRQGLRTDDGPPTIQSKSRPAVISICFAR